MHWGSPTADNHQDQRSGRPDGARRPTTAHWTGSDWSWCAMRGGRRHGGGQPCKHGNLHQLSSEQWPMWPRQPQRAHQQGGRLRFSQFSRRTCQSAAEEQAFLILLALNTLKRHHTVSARTTSRLPASSVHFARWTLAAPSPT